MRAAVLAPFIVFLVALSLASPMIATTSVGYPAIKDYLGRVWSITDIKKETIKRNYKNGEYAPPAFLTEEITKRNYK